MHWAVVKRWGALCAGRRCVLCSYSYVPCCCRVRTSTRTFTMTSWTGADADAILEAAQAWMARDGLARLAAAVELEWSLLGGTVTLEEFVRHLRDHVAVAKVTLWKEALQDFAVTHHAGQKPRTVFDPDSWGKVAAFAGLGKRVPPTPPPPSCVLLYGLSSVRIHRQDPK